MSTSEIEDAVRAHEPAIAERFIAAALVESERRPELLECYPPSFVASVAISERVEIPVDSRVGAAYLSVQRGARREALFLPGYPAWGFAMKRADPEIVFTDAEVVRARDDFRFEHATAPAFVIPNRPRVSSFLQRVAALVGVAPVDGFRHIPYQGQDAGGVVAVYAYAVYRSGVVKRVLLRRDELRSISEKEWGTPEGQWKLRGHALRTLAKTLVRTHEIGALIYLARGDERSSYMPRSLDVCRTLGITVYEQPAEFRGERAQDEGGPEGASKAIADSQADRSDHTQGVPGASGPPVPNTNHLKLRCCGCGNNDKPVYRSKAFSLIGHNSETCQTESTAMGTFHDLCGSCRDAHYKAWGEERQIHGEKASKRLAKRAAKKSAASGPGAVAAAMGVRPGSHDLAPDQETASAAAPAEGRMDSSSAASTKAEDLASSANDGPAEPSDGNSIPETSNGSSALVSTGSAGPSSSSGGAPC